MAKKQEKKGSNAALGIGVGLTTAAVAAAGAYFLYGSKQAPKNRKKIKGWMLKAKGEILEALEQAEEMTEAEYRTLIETAAAAYSLVQGATKGEVADFKKEMGAHWDKIKKSGVVKKAAAVAATAAKGVVVKKPAKKVATVAKKAAKKVAPKKK